VKASAYTIEGRFVADQASNLNLLQPASGAAEQDPDDLVNQAIMCLAACVSKIHTAGYSRIEAVALSSIHGSIIPLAGNGSPLHDAMIWGDLRPSSDAIDAKDLLDEDTLYKETGCQIHSFYVGPKLAWFRRCRPSIFQNATHFVPTKTYLVKQLCGEMLIDRSVASGSGMLQMANPVWNTTWLSYLDVEATQLGQIVEPSTALAFLPEVCHKVGLPEGTPLVIGAGDGMLSSLGVGALQPGQYAAMLATSGAFRTVRPEPELHPQKKTWALYLADGLWVCGSSLSSGGIVYRWIRDTFFQNESLQLIADGQDGYDVVNKAAAAVAGGSEGLLMLPYLSGERSPNWNIDARGTFVGLNLSHDRRHLARAAMEGISIHFALAAKALYEVCGPPSEIRATGGFRKSKLWIQMMADTLGQQLALPPNVDASGLGAALLAMRTLGVYDSLCQASKLVPIEDEIAPAPEAVRRYADLSIIYEKVYECLAPAFNAIASAPNAKT